MAYKQSAVIEATERCLEKLVSALKKNKNKNKFEFNLTKAIRQWAGKNGISEEDMKSFVQEVREAVEGAVLTYGLTEDLLEKRAVARARAERLFYSGVYTLYEPLREWSSEKMREDEV